MTPSNALRPAPALERGTTLVIALVMLLAVGLMSTAVMRRVGLSDQIALNARLRAQAAEFAQLALRWCAHQIELASTAVTIYPADAVAAWTETANWRGDGPRPAYTLAAATDFSGIGAPRVLPQCLVERTSIDGVFSVAARGLSPDFVADPVTGQARVGSQVWLQSDVLAPPPGHRIVARTWQQLLTPP